MTETDSLPDRLARLATRPPRATVPRRLQRWKENARAFAIAPLERNRRTEATKTLSWLRDRMSAQSPAAAALFRQADRAGVWIGFDSQPGNGGYYDPNQRMVALGCVELDEAARFRKAPRLGLLASILAHELRHARQHMLMPELVSRGDFAPADRILISRYMEADAEAHAILVCWQLKQAGWAQPWNQSRKSYAPLFGPMYDAFEAACLKDPAAAEDGRALAKAFEGWFKCQRLVSFYDRHHANFFTRLADNGLRHSAGRRVTPDELSRLCQVGGVNYFGLLSERYQSAKLGHAQGARIDIKSKKVARQLKRDLRRLGHSRAGMGLFAG